MRVVPATGTVLSDGDLFALLWDTLADVFDRSDAVTFQKTLFETNDLSNLLRNFR